MSKEALKLALEALENIDRWLPTIGQKGLRDYEADAITAIKEALAQPWEKFCDSNCVWTDHHPDCKLAQPEQEPVAWRAWVSKFPQGTGSDWVYVTKPIMKDSVHNQPLYTTPPQRKPLTDEEILTYRHMIDWTAEWSYINFARAIEAAHGIKGEA
jgi:hypothetical protein